VTSAEAIRELRLLLAGQLRRPSRDVDWRVIRAMLWDVYCVRESGCNWLIELRLRRYRRLAAQRKTAPNGRVD
jgi:hypothetical protein